MRHVDFLKKSEKLKVTKIAREAVTRALEELVPDQDTSPIEINKIKNNIYQAILRAANDYTGRFDTVPNLYLANAIKREIPHDSSQRQIQEISHIANIIESVKGRNRNPGFRK